MTLQELGIAEVTAAEREKPVPFGVQAATGKVRPPYDASAVEVDDKKIQERGNPKKHLAIIPGLHPEIPGEAGWGIVFASNAKPEIVEAMTPLIEWRKQQVNNDIIFKVFSKGEGVEQDQSAVSWLSTKGVGLAPVDPENGVPYHLLLIGSPQEIPFEFQYTLDLQWSVGRLHFDTPEEYRAYADRVVAYEKNKIASAKTVAMWMAANGDLATTLLCTDVGVPFFQKGLGKRQGFSLEAFFAAKATKENLRGILSGEKMQGGKPPALLFTGSHGLEVEMANATEQRERQGALVTQEWRPGTAVGDEASFAGSDVPGDVDLTGTIQVLFACFGGGCPEMDNYPESGATKQIAPHAFVGRLPQRLLRQGALAVIGHVDRAWNFSFQSGTSLPQNQVLKGLLDGIMMGVPVGTALDITNLQWGTLAAQLGMLAGSAAVPASLSNLVIARDDARNYALFGDPSARLH